MNVSNFGSPEDTKSIFIESNNLHTINELNQLKNTASGDQIKQFFYPSSRGKDIDIHKITNNQINKHLQVLNNKNKSTLKNLLKSNLKGDLTNGGVNIWK